MNSLQHSRYGEIRNDGGHYLIKRFKAWMAVIGEWFWFGFSFVLFLALGPFSAVVVLIGLKSLASEERQLEMTEPAKVI